MEVINDLKIEKLDHFGRGIVKQDNIIIFIEGAIPDEVVDIKINKKKKNIIEAEVINIKEESKYYKEPICPHYKDCGGCNILNLIYEKQLEFKERKIQELVNKMLKDINDDIKINSIISSNNNNYRNKLVLHSENNKIGLYKKKSNDLIEIDKCYLVDNKINEIVKRLNEYKETHKCTIKDITIKTTTLNESMISIYGSFDYEEFKKYFNDIKVIYINNQLVTKDSYIKEKLFDKYFYISNHSFFQVNKYNTENLYKKVLDNIKDKKYKNALDLYCGTGTITILLSDYVDKVYGIEVVEDAIKDANRNKELNNKDNIEFILGKTEDNLDTFKDIDLVVVDPPREGLDKKAITNLLRINPEKIIYVSCDPSTLMRDLNLLKDNYNIKEITPCDMFPNTYHVESVAILERK